MVVAGEDGEVILAVPGPGVIWLQVPAPVAAIVAAPPGNTAQLTIWSAPALGLTVTVTVIVSEQPAALVHFRG